MRTPLLWTVVTALCILETGTACRSNTPVETTPTPEATPTPQQAAEEVENTAPRVTKVTLKPGQPTVRDEIRAVPEARDPDGDYVTFTYRWFVNGRQLLGQISEVLPAGEARHGDTVQVEVVPHDPRGNEGDPFRSETITVRNSPPELLERLSPGMSIDGYRMKVEDPDGDPITFRLENAPPSMHIDPDGTIRWTPSASDKPGLYKVTMVASDDQGASVTVVFPAKVLGPTTP